MTTRRVEAWAVVNGDGKVLCTDDDKHDAALRAAHHDAALSPSKGPHRVVHLTGELPDEPQTIRVGPWLCTGIHRDIEPGEDMVEVDGPTAEITQWLCQKPSDAAIIDGHGSMRRFLAKGFSAKWVGHDDGGED